MEEEGWSVINNFSKEEENVVQEKLTIHSLKTDLFGHSPPPFPIYKKVGKKLLVPKFWGISNFNIEPKYNKTAEPIDVKFVGELNEKDYSQKSTVKKAMLAYENGGGGCLSLPCGYGKTVVALYLIAQVRLKTIILVHKEFLMKQWISYIAKFLPTAKVGIIRGEKMEIEGFDISICMIQSLITGRYPKKVFRPFGHLVCDEVHRLPTTEFWKSFPLVIGCPKTLGLSATPYRDDGQSRVFFYFLGPMFQLIRRQKGTGPPVVVERLTATESGSIIKLRNGDINYSAMVTDLCCNLRRNNLIVKKVMTFLSENRKIIILSDRIEQLDYFLTRFKLLEVSVGMYVGGMKEEQRQISAKCSVILGTYSMAAEGLSIDDLDTLVLASPKRKIEQACGRIMRREEGKTRLIVDVYDDFSSFANMWWARQTYYNQIGAEIVMKEKKRKVEPCLVKVKHQKKM